MANPLNLAFCLFKYFPYGGLQRDCLRIALACRDRGHSIQLFTMSWEGERPSGIEVTLVPASGWTNHRRCNSFATRVEDEVRAKRFAAVVGFNKMPGLNVYFAGDPCYKAQVLANRGLFYRHSPRCRTYLSLEQSVFAPSAGTEILLLAEPEKTKFIECYHTPEERFHLMPPGISRDRQAPENADALRHEVRREFGIADDEWLMLMIGSDFERKGVDRSMRALAGLPAELRRKTRLFVIGCGKSAPQVSLARRLGVADRVQLLGGREDVPRFLLGADLLLHPARSETAGMVLIEALAAGLPVLATDVCGYAFHIGRARAGHLVPSSFDQMEFTMLVERMLTAPERNVWKANALAYVARTDVFNLAEKAADLIEAVAAKPAASLR